MASAAERAPQNYGPLGWQVLETLVLTRVTFTPDDFWEAFEHSLREHGLTPRAGRDWSGALFSKAYRRGLIKRTGAFVNSARPEAHAKQIPVLTGGSSRAKPCPHCKGTGVV